MNAPTDEQLLQAYLDGRHDSFELLVRRYTQELFHCVYRLVGSSAVAEDVVQEAFLQVHLSASRFDPSRKFRPWVFTIAVNKARDALRVRRRHKETSLDHCTTGTGEGPCFADTLADTPVNTAPEPALHMEAEERSLRIRGLVSELPGHLREVLILGYYHGFAYKEMAAILDIPLGTIKSRLHAAVTAFGKLHIEREPEQQAASSNAASGTH